MPFVLKNPDIYFTTQIWKRCRNIIRICLIYEKPIKSKSSLCITLFSCMNTRIYLWVILFLSNIPTKYVILIPLLQHTTWSWVITYGIGELLQTFTSSSDLALISHSTLICAITGKSYIKQLPSWGPYTCENWFIQAPLYSQSLVCRKNNPYFVGIETLLE